MIAHAAPIHGFAHELTAMLAMTAVRQTLSTASNAPNGLNRMRMLIALEARNTMKNAIIITGTMSAL